MRICLIPSLAGNRGDVRHAELKFRQWAIAKFHRGLGERLQKWREQAHQAQLQLRMTKFRYGHREHLAVMEFVTVFAVFRQLPKLRDRDQVWKGSHRLSDSSAPAVITFP